MNQLKVVTLAGDPVMEPSIASGLASARDIDLLLRCVDRIEALGAIRSGRVDAIISVGAPAWFDRQCRSEASLAGIRLLVLTTEADDEWHRAGLVLPADTPLEVVIAQARDADPAKVPTPASRSDRGRLVAVWGPKGSPGRTRVAIELACVMAGTGEDTMLIDGDPYGGDILQLLAMLEEVPTIVWASRMAAKGELDRDEIEQQLRRIGSSGPVVLPGLSRPELWAEISDFAWRELLDVSLHAFESVICDVGFCVESAGTAAEPGGRNRMTRVALDQADRVVAVCRPDPVGIKHFVWSFEELRGHVDVDRVLVVLNRADGRRARDAAAVLRKHLGKRVVVALPDVPHEMARAETRGLAFAEISGPSPFLDGIRSLASLLGARVAPHGTMIRLAGR